MLKKKQISIKNTVLGDGIPRICIPVTGRTNQEIREQVRAAAAENPDLLEWRADFYENIESREASKEILTAISDLCGQIPILFTFRSGGEGGNRYISTEMYRDLNLWASYQKEVDLLDVEGRQSGLDAKALIEEIHRAGKPTVGSCHFFQMTPEKEEMLVVMEELRKTGADILKLAVMPSCETDVLKLMEATLEMDARTECPLITMAMGRMGAVSRICGRLTGSALTFGTAGQASAPGQLPAKDLRRILELL